MKEYFQDLSDVVHLIIPYITNIKNICMPSDLFVTLKQKYYRFIQYVRKEYGLENVKKVLGQCLLVILKTQSASVHYGVGAWITMLTYDYERSMNHILKCADEIDSELIRTMQTEYNIMIPDIVYSEFMSPEKNIVIFSLLVNMINHWNFIVSDEAREEKRILLKNVLQCLAHKRIINIETNAKHYLEISLYDTEVIKTHYTDIKYCTQVLKSHIFPNDDVM
jgi:hypothetical protein